MNNICTQANSNYKQKKNKIIMLISFLIITITLIFITINYVKVFNTHGHSMQPTISDNSFVVCIKTNDIKPGDIIAFTSRGDTKIKRVIALPEDEVNIDEYGQVTINGQILKEDYLKNTTFGEAEIPLPHKVSQNSYFVLGDNRGNSLDSRHFSIGDISFDDIICEVKLVL